MSGIKKAPGAPAGASNGYAAHEDRSKEQKPQGVPAVLQRFFSDADKYLSDAPLAQQASAFTGLRPSVLVAGLAVFMLVSLGTGFGGGLVCDVAGFLYPGRRTCWHQRASCPAAAPFAQTLKVLETTRVCQRGAAGFRRLSRRTVAAARPVTLLARSMLS